MEISISLASKLGSIAVHVEEYFSKEGHEFDRIETVQLINDPEVKAFLFENRALLPAKRT